MRVVRKLAFVALAPYLILQSVNTLSNLKVSSLIVKLLNNSLNPIRKLNSKMFQAISSTQFYLYGRSHFTKTGYDAHKLLYDKDDTVIVEDTSLLTAEHDTENANKVFLITGANSGIGFELSSYLARRNCIVFMVCRNEERGKEAVDRVLKSCTNNGNKKVHLLLCDVGSESDVRKVVADFESSYKSAYGKSDARLDALVCNAGALCNAKTLSNDGTELTFASHLLYGSYLLGKLALPTLRRTEKSRLVFVSSGGMYNHKFPEWEIATHSTDAVKYDGQMAYVYAKRGQVLLAEQWSKLFPEVTIVSCHPGWCETPGVEKAYGKDAGVLKPLRNLWEGAEGIAWLTLADSTKIESGAFYLDRKPQTKHLSGAFFSEGSFTKNSDEEVDDMMGLLDRYTESDSIYRPSLALTEAKLLNRKTVKSISAMTDKDVDMPKFMGRWHVLAHIPTAFEKNTFDNYENYIYRDVRKDIAVAFQYSSLDDLERKSQNQMSMIARVFNAPINSHWKLNIKYGITWPIDLNYLVFDAVKDSNGEYLYTIVGVPDRSAVWIMTKLKPKTNHPKLSGKSFPFSSKEQALSEKQQRDIIRDVIVKIEGLGYDSSKLKFPPYSDATLV